MKGRCPRPLDEGDGVGGARRDRTADLYNAIVALSQLSYGPDEGPRILRALQLRCQRNPHLSLNPGNVLDVIGLFSRDGFKLTENALGSYATHTHVHVYKENTVMFTDLSRALLDTNPVVTV